MKCSVTPAWKYTHSEQLLSQVLLQVQPSVFDLSAAAWPSPSAASEHPDRSASGAQHCAGQAWYTGPPKPLDHVLARARKSR